MHIAAPRPPWPSLAYHFRDPSTSITTIRGTTTTPQGAELTPPPILPPSTFAFTLDLPQRLPHPYSIDLEVPTARTATAPTTTTTLKLIKQMLHHARQPPISRSSSRTPTATVTSTTTSRPLSTGGAPKRLLLRDPKQYLKQRLRLTPHIPISAAPPATMGTRRPAAAPGALALALAQFQPLVSPHPLDEIHQLADERLLLLLARAMLVLPVAATFAAPLVFDADAEELAEECLDASV